MIKDGREIRFPVSGVRKSQRLRLQGKLPQLSADPGADFMAGTFYGRRRFVVSLLVAGSVGGGSGAEESMTNRGQSPLPQ